MVWKNTEIWYDWCDSLSQIISKRNWKGNWGIIMIITYHIGEGHV